MNSNKKRIAYIVTTLVNCGPTNQLYNLIKHLPREEFDIVILTLFKEPKNSRHQDFLNLGIEVKQLGMTRKKVIIDKNSFVRTVEELNPDVIHSNSIRTDMLCCLYLNKYPLVTTIHSSLPEDYRWSYGAFFGKLITWLHCKFLAQIDYPIACSYTISKKLNKKYGIKSYTVQNGIDCDYYSPVSKEEKWKLRKVLGFDTSKTIFIYSGNLSRLKDPVTVVKAFLEAKISDKANLVLLGDGELMEELKKIEVMGVKIVGRVDNVVDYLRAGDVLVSASHTEGMPMSVLEGMGAGLPVLLSKIESHIEILGNNSRAGDLFEIENVSELSSYMRLYTERDLYEKGEAARKIIEEKFSSRVMSGGYYNIYKQISTFSKEVRS